MGTLKLRGTFRSDAQDKGMDGPSGDCCPFTRPPTWLGSFDVWLRCEHHHRHHNYFIGFCVRLAFHQSLSTYWKTGGWFVPVRDHNPCSAPTSETRQVTQSGACISCVHSSLSLCTVTVRRTGPMGQINLVSWKWLSSQRS